MATNLFDLIEVSPEAAAFVDRSFQIADQIRHVLREKGWSQRDLAVALGKKEPEISRMLIGTHNFTLKTLARLEVALGAPLITTPQRVHEQATGFTMQATITDRDQLTDLTFKKLVTVSQTCVSSLGSLVITPEMEKATGNPAAFFAPEFY